MTVELPEDWTRSEPDEDRVESVARHRHLDVAVSVSGDTADAAPDDGRTITVEWAVPRVRGTTAMTTLDPPEPVTTEAAAERVAELADCITAAFEPGDTEYVERAVRGVTEGTIPDRTFGTAPMAAVCRVCEAPLFHYRGDSRYREVENHLAFTNDEDHDDRTVSPLEHFTPGPAPIVKNPHTE
jgi:hypothetical protein